MVSENISLGYVLRVCSVHFFKADFSFSNDIKRIPSLPPLLRRSQFVFFIASLGVKTQFRNVLTDKSCLFYPGYIEKKNLLPVSETLVFLLIRHWRWQGGFQWVSQL